MPVEKSEPHIKAVLEDCGDCLTVVQQKPKSFMTLCAETRHAHTTILIGTKAARELIEVLRRCVGDE